jgi:SM-20-related protein
MTLVKLHDVEPLGSKPIDENVDEEARALAFLRSHSGVNMRHSEGTLLAHLEGVYRILQRWQCRPALCFAGLFHSVYGTEHFRRQAIPVAARPRVAEIIGSEAEGLAFEFCILDTRAFIADIEKIAAGADQQKDNSTLLSPKQGDLLHLFVANWIEQFPRMRSMQRTRYMTFLKRAKPFLILAAAEEIESLYGFDIAPSAKSEVISFTDSDHGTVDLTTLDNFVPPHLQHRLSALMERNIWRYGWKAADTQTGHYFWHSHFAGDNDDGGETDCEAELEGRPLIAPVVELWHHVRARLAEDHILVRAYANGHTFGSDGHLHTDSTSPGHFTSIYYAHPRWEPNWGGETVFFDANQVDVVKAVHPLPGRLVHFNGNISHAARSPTRDCPALRSVVVLKTYCPTYR